MVTLCNVTEISVKIPEMGKNWHFFWDIFVHCHMLFQFRQHFEHFFSSNIQPANSQFVQSESSLRDGGGDFLHNVDVDQIYTCKKILKITPFFKLPLTTLAD